MNSRHLHLTYGYYRFRLIVSAMREISTKRRNYCRSMNKRIYRRSPCIVCDLTAKCSLIYYIKCFWFSVHPVRCTKRTESCSSRAYPSWNTEKVSIVNWLSNICIDSLGKYLCVNRWYESIRSRETNGLCMDGKRWTNHCSLNIFAFQWIGS